ncbi:hypothetical protein K503DRAFT_787358 [Rhizopogon vinicolor AM-OR11-026]|uniref:Uncharacterized protein n=1 Tax=Rhizopogon vinicolor AM-OR11-026 TaxID=1314800 RepID=A0A1B7MHW8_9AGAM|nr:hypothetical protein K503DRAFT_787358 [Rhizopogon vinicolor AM-OR11-026]
MVRGGIERPSGIYQSMSATTAPFPFPIITSKRSGMCSTKALLAARRDLWTCKKYTNAPRFWPPDINPRVYSVPPHAMSILGGGYRTLGESIEKGKSMFILYLLLELMQGASPVAIRHRNETPRKASGVCATLITGSLLVFRFTSVAFERMITFADDLHSISGEVDRKIPLESMVVCAPRRQSTPFNQLRVSNTHRQPTSDSTGSLSPKDAFAVLLQGGRKSAL